MSIKKRSNSNMLKSIIPIALRISFSLVLAYAIAVPIEIEMFRPSIERQIAKDNQEQIVKIIKEVEQRKEELANESASRIKAVKDKIIAIDKSIEANNILFNKERRGQGVSGLKGEGKSSKIYEDKIKEEQQEKEELIRQRQSIEKSTAYKQKMIDKNAITEMEYYGFAKENASELFANEEDVKTKSRGKSSDIKNKAPKKSDKNKNNTGDLVKVTSDNQTSIKNNIPKNGLEREIEALEEISKRPAISWWKSITKATLLIMEIAPVFLKLLFPYGPYDALLETKEKRVLKREHEIVEKFLGTEIYNDLKAEQDIKDLAREYKKKRIVKENEQIYNLAASKRRKERELQQVWFSLTINKIKSKLFGKDWEDWVEKRAEELGEELFGKRNIKQNVDSLIKKTAKFAWMPFTFLIGGINSIGSEVYKQITSGIGKWIVDKIKK